MEVREVTVRFGDKTVLDRFSLTLPDRGLTLLMAPSGRGKTTLLRVMAGLIRPREGRVILPGRPVMLFQEDRLFPRLNALRQVESILPKERRGEAAGLLGLTELEEAARLTPGELSGGMARRLALARALAADGEVLLLDEPFAGVDLERAGRILERLRALDRPVVLTGHAPELAKGCDRTVEM